MFDVDDVVVAVVVVVVAVVVAAAVVVVVCFLRPHSYVPHVATTWTFCSTC